MNMKVINFDKNEMVYGAQIIFVFGVVEFESGETAGTKNRFSQARLIK
jgi:hypothetical protein